MIQRRRFAAALVAATFLTLPSHDSWAAQPLDVVASFSILGDMVGAVGGERVRVVTLVGPGSDAHVYQPTPADARAVGMARVVVVNGLGFEGWMERLITAAGYRGPVVIASSGVPPLAADDSDHGGLDPHAWQNLAHARSYVKNIAEALAAADPAGASDYRARAEHYRKEIDVVDAEIRSALARLPAARRRIVTSHDAFGYFASAYGMEFLAPVGLSTETEASAKEIATLIRQIRTEKIGAIFIEGLSDSRLLERITHETGATIGGRLFSDTLSGPEGPAPTYLEMMRHNLRTLLAAIGA